MACTTEDLCQPAVAVQALDAQGHLQGTHGELWATSKYSLKRLGPGVPSPALGAVGAHPLL